MIHQINKIKQQSDLIPDKDWLRVDKAALLSEISLIQKQRQAENLSLGQQAELVSLRITRRFVPSTVKLVVFAVMVLTISSTGFMAQAAVPGDLLYTIKISLEKAELTFANDPVSEAEISMKHADNRLRELAVISSKENIDPQVKDQAMAELVRRMEKNIVAADSSLKIAKSSGDANRVNKTLNLARNLSRRAESTAKTLEQQAKAIAGVVVVDGRVIASNQKIYKQVKVNKQSGVDIKSEEVRGKDVVTAFTEAIKLHEGVSTNADNTVLEMKDQDNNAVAQSEVNDLMTNRIASQQSKLDDIKKVMASIDEQSVRKLILEDTTKSVLYPQYIKLAGQVKEAETDLAAAAKLLTEGKEDGAGKKLEASKTLIDSITSILAQVNIIGTKQEEKDARVEKDANAAATTGSIKIETVSKGATSTETRGQ
ncbi:MAG: DUF5667 domain-containing protein [Candidatus Komeilibacteria bacterium]